MAFRTPWDDLDIDVNDVTPHIRRLKLPAPSLYFALLPFEQQPQKLETKWQNVNSAHDVRVITARCVEYERGILNEIANRKLQDSAAIPTASESQEQANKDSGPAVTTSSASATDQKRNTQKRGRSTKSPSTTPTRKSRRLKFTKDTLQTTVPSFVYQSNLPLPAQVHPERPEGNNITIPKMPSGSKSSNPDSRPSKCYPINNPDPSINLVDIHQKIYCAVDAWHDLVLQAEAMEHRLVAIESGLDIRPSSVRQVDMSKDELEEQLERVQSSADKLVRGLNVDASSALESIGPRSHAMAVYRSADIRKGVMMQYDSDVDWEMKKLGVFAWWLAHSHELCC